MGRAGKTKETAVDAPKVSEHSHEESVSTFTTISFQGTVSRDFFFGCCAFINHFPRTLDYICTIRAITMFR